MSPGVRNIWLGPTDVEIERRPDGSCYLRSPHPLDAYPTRLTERLLHFAAVAPDRVFIAERADDGRYRAVTYRMALEAARSIGQALLDRGLSASRPLAILSGHDVQHALLALAALHVGIPFAPIATAYSLVSSDFSKLKHVLELLEPGMIYAASGADYARAINAVVPAEVEVVAARDPLKTRATTPFAALLEATATPDVEAAFARVDGDTLAKVLFTSGSTGLPKGVLNTQRMLCANQQQILQTFPFMAEEPPVLVDWLPWNHTFGGNHNFGLTLYNGGSLYIDDGAPTAAGLERTARNLREISPTMYFNVPRGYEMLVPLLRADAALREHFYRRLRMTFYAGAHLPQHVWDALDALAVETCGERVLMLTGLGATETSPFALCANWDTRRAGMLGVPTYGLDLKLVPNGRKLEARVRGPNVTPGYMKQLELTQAVFDHEGYYCMGDAVAFLDPDDASKGLLFDGRVAEDFKLASGTWVSVGPLRATMLKAGAAYIEDVVIAGHDRNELGVLVFPDVFACRGLCPELEPSASAALVLASSGVRQYFSSMLSELAASSTGSATRISRGLILSTPPSLDRGEITDKGSINQRAVLDAREDEVRVLFAEAGDASRVILPVVRVR